MNILKTDMGRPITVLAFIGIVDMLFTGAGLMNGWFGEANPMLDWAWMGYGIFGFMALKSAFIFGTSLVFTWARTHQPNTADRYARVAIALYVLIFFMGVGAQLL